MVLHNQRNTISMNTSALFFRTSAAVCSEMSTVCSEVKQCGEDGVVRGWRGIQAGGHGHG